MVLGTWVRDAGCQYGASATKLEIESNGEGRYTLTVYEPKVTSYPPKRKINGIFKKELGKSLIAISIKGYTGYSTKYLEIFPETKQIEYDGCYYSKH